MVAVGVIAGVLACLLAVGFLLPSHRAVSRTVSTSAKPSDIYPLIASLRAGWRKWSPLLPEGLEFRYDGPERGVGATQTWQGKAGHGSMTIVRADPAHGVGYETKMDMGGMRGVGDLLLVSSEAGTRITWSDELQLGRNPFWRWMGLAMDGMRAKNLMRGLERLKDEAEHNHLSNSAEDSQKTAP